MNNKKENSTMSFEYLSLDKCKDDKERAAKLQGDIEKRKVELKQVKKEYDKVISNILDGWRIEVETRFPSLQIQTHSPKGGDLIETFVFNGVHYEAVLGRLIGKYKFICMIRVELEDFREDKYIDDAVVTRFNDILPWMKGNYCLFKEFDCADFDNVFACYIELITRFEKLSN